MCIEYPPTKSISELVKRMKGRTSRLSRIEEKILGETLLGNRIWGMEYRKFDRGNGRRVLRTSSEPIEWGYGKLHVGMSGLSVPTNRWTFSPEWF